MSNIDKFDDDLEPQTKSKAPVFLGIGCMYAFLIALILIGAVCVGGGMISRNSIKRKATESIAQGLIQEIRKSKLSNKQKDGIVEHVDRLKNRYKEGRITTLEVIEVLGEIGSSPLLPLGLIWSGFSTHVPKSHLNKVRQIRALRDYQRFARGVVEKKIGTDKVELVCQIITNKQSNMPMRQISPTKPMKSILHGKSAKPSTRFWTND
jgi:hypothetical protein